MAETFRDLGGQKSYDLPKAHAVTRYYVKIDGIEKAVFSEVSGLQMETELFEYAEGGNNGYIHRLPGLTKAGNVTLKRGICKDNDFLKWFHQITQGTLKLKTVTITIYSNDKDKSPMMVFELRQAFPCKWSGPQLIAGSEAVAVESVEFAHMGILYVTP